MNVTELEDELEIAADEIADLKEMNAALVEDNRRLERLVALKDDEIEDREDLLADIGGMVKEYV